jgi:hypothetical protein
MKKLIFLSCFLFALNTCSENPVTDDTPQPGRRDYTWTIDTLNVPEGRSIPSWMWGTGTNNIWALGTSYTNAYAIWHYNGSSWKNYVPDKYLDPRGLWGSSSNDIWTGSSDGSMWHYNGTMWSEYSVINIPGYQTFIVQSIAGSSANNVYAVGFADSIDGSTYKGVLVHYNGIEWQQVNIPNIRNSFVQIAFDDVSKSVIFKGWEFDKPDEYIYSFNGKELKNIFHTTMGIDLSSIGKNIYAKTNFKLYKYQNETLSIFKDFSSTNYEGGTWGRSELDFFTINWDGIGHYNGTDLITIYQKKNNDWSPDGAIIFEKDVFFIWNDFFNTFIVHGKLKN